MRRPDAGQPIGLTGSWPVAAGWYRDSVDGRLHRYWDGSAWRSTSGEAPQQRGLARVQRTDPFPPAPWGLRGAPDDERGGEQPGCEVG